MTKMNIKIWTYITLLFYCIKGFAVDNVTLVAPFNGANTEISNVLFEWNRQYTDVNFTIQISDNQDFSNIIHQAVVTNDFYAYSLPAPNTYYYWRVKSDSRPYSSISNIIWFTPKMVPNLRVWLSSDTGVVITNGKVSQWTDLSGNNNHAKQADTSKQPIVTFFSTTTTNKPSVSFDGANDVLGFTSTMPLIKTSFTYLKHTTGTNTLGVSTGLYPGIYTCLTNDYVGYQTTSLFYPYNPPNIVMQGIGFNNGDSVSPTKFTKPTNFRLFNFIHSSLSYAAIGRANNITSYWQGEYLESILYSDSISYSNRKKVENYIFSRYTPPVNLGKNIIAINFCAKYDLNAGNGYLSYIWSTGETSPQIKVNATGNYSVKVIDINGKEWVDTINIYPPLKQLGGRPYNLCKGDSVKVDLDLPSGFTASWSDGRTGGILYFKKNGKYFVNIQDNEGCSHLDSIYVNIDSFAFNAPNFPDVITCRGLPLSISNSFGLDSVLWSTGNSSDSIYLNSGGNYSVFARSVNGCEINKSFNVTIKGDAPTANFEVGTICKNAATQFNDLSVAPSGNNIVGWTWNFGDGVTSEISSPKHTFVSQGNQNVSLEVTTDVGCKGIIEKIVPVSATPNANFYFPNICSGNTVRFFDSTTISNGSIAIYNWKFGEIGTSVDKNPYFSFPSSGYFPVTLIVRSSDDCRDTVTKSVQVLSGPKSNFTYSTACVGQVINFTNTSTIDPSTNIVSRSWYFGDGTSSNLNNPTKGYSVAGTYNVTLINVSNQGCLDSVQKQVAVLNFPNAKFEMISAPCANSPLTFADSSNSIDVPITAWQWKVNNNIVSTDKNLNINSLLVGNYNVELKVTNANGCAISKIKTYAITEPPIVNFELDPEYADPPATITFTNLSPANLSFMWNFGDGPVGAFTYNTSHTYTQLGVYDVALTGTDLRGCKTTTTKTFVANKPTVDVALIDILPVVNDNIYKPIIRIENKSNVNIKKMTVVVRFEDGTSVLEDWSGVLAPNTILNYTFISSLISSNKSPVLCAEILSVNNSTTIESDYSNNKICSASDLSAFKITSIVPNPATSAVSVGFILPKSGELVWEIYDALGNVVLQSNRLLVAKGYNNITLDITTLAKGNYILSAYFEGETLGRKLSKL
jgi:PKD repeat protein